MKTKALLALLAIILSLPLSAKEEAFEIASRLKTQGTTIHGPKVVLYSGDFGKASVTPNVTITGSPFKLPVGITVTAQVEMQNSIPHYCMLFSIRNYLIVPQENPKQYAGIFKTSEVSVSGEVEFGKETEIQLPDGQSLILTFRKIPPPENKSKTQQWGANDFLTFTKERSLSLKEIKKKFDEPNRIVNENSQATWEYDLRDKRKIKIYASPTSNNVTKVLLINPYTNITDTLFKDQ